MEDVQTALAQVMRVMVTLAAGLWSGHATHATLSDAASSVGSVQVLDAFSTPPAPAPGHMVSGQPGRDVAVDAGIVSVRGRRIYATSVDRSGIMPMNAISRGQSRPSGV